MVKKKEPDPAHKPRRSRIGATVKALLRTRIVAGLLVVLPIWVTFLLIRFFFEFMRDSSRWVVEWFLRSKGVENVLQKLGFQWQAFPSVTTDAAAGVHGTTLEEMLVEYPSIDWGIAIFSVALTLFLLYFIGVLAANIVGRRAIEIMEGILDRVPLVKTIYRATKQIVSTFAGEQSKEFQRVALIPFPQEKMRSVGFITSIFNDSLTGEELASVFIPTTPNPTTGYLQILRRKDLVELDWSVEDAVRTIMSGGILRPDFLTIVPTKELENLPRGPDGQILPPPKPAAEESG